MEPQNVGGALPDSFEPIFDDLIHVPWSRSVQRFQGDKLLAQDPNNQHSHWATLNVKTLEAEVYDGERNQGPRHPFAEEPIVRRLGADSEICLVQETETVLHLRTHLNDYVVFKELFDEAEFLERLEYNEPLDGLGVFELPLGARGISNVHLFPNSRSKVLIGMHYRTGWIDVEPSREEEYTWLYIVDVDPDTAEDDRAQFLTVVPSRPVNWMNWMQRRQRRGFPSNLDFEVTAYNGLLHVFWKGRLVPLWADLTAPEGAPSTGRSRELDTPQFLKCTKRLNVRINLDNPVVTGIVGYLPVSENITKLIRGKKKNGLTARYVTLGGTSGRLIGDLKTGETYIAKDRNSGRRWRNFLFPGITPEGDVTYYRWAKAPARKVCQLLDDALAEGSSGTLMRSVDLKSEIRDIFNDHPVSGWKFPECSDYDYKLGIHGSITWWAITEDGWKVDPQALEAMSDKVDEIVAEFVHEEVPEGEE